MENKIYCHTNGYWDDHNCLDSRDCRYGTPDGPDDTLKECDCYFGEEDKEPVTVSTITSEQLELLEGELLEYPDIKLRVYEQFKVYSLKDINNAHFPYLVTEIRKTKEKYKLLCPTCRKNRN